MLSYPDFSEKQLLMIESSDLKELSIKNSNLTSKQDGKLVHQVPLAKIFAVFVVGQITFTSAVLQKLTTHGVCIVFMTKNLRPYCVFGGETEGNTLLREQQYFAKDSLQIAQHIVKNKIQNQLSVLKKIRKKTKTEKESLEQLKKLQNSVDQIKDSKALLGVEGSASKVYFKTYFGKFKWRGRKPRTKYDEINTLMDIGYTFLFYFTESHLRLYGFDVYKGFYHTNFYQRKSLVCDFMEPLRPLIDQVLRKMLALKQVDMDDFEVRQGGYHLKRGKSGKYCVLFLQELMNYKSEIFHHFQSLYRYFIKSNKNEFPYFSL